jgi:adenylylsulfate kinase
METVAGRVYWITGLAGAGKTTLASALAQRLAQEGTRAILLDGDALRAALGQQSDYTPSARLQLAMGYVRLCKLLADQGFDVICATVSMFNEVRAWGRQQIDGYKVIYLRAPHADLCARRSIYSDAQTRHEVVLPEHGYQLPDDADLILDNDGLHTPQQLADRILQRFADAPDSQPSSL